MVLVPRLSDLPPEANKEKQEFEQQGIQSILAVPMIISGKVIGFIGLDSVRDEKMWAEDTSSLLKIVGQVFANALENKNARQALQQSEERLRIVYETFPDSVTIINAKDGCCVDVNSAFTRLTGWSAEDVIGKTAADLDIWHNPGDRENLTAGIARNGKAQRRNHHHRIDVGRFDTA